MSKPERAVLTLAMSQPVYVDLAVNLARSFLLWNSDRDTRFVLCTDQPERVPSDVRARVDVRAVERDAYGQGFSPKLHLDRLAPAARTLFVDADSLCVGSLEPLFERFAGRAVSVIGGAIERGDWFGDVAALCRTLGVARLTKFNGGVYYLEPGATATAVYETARALKPRYDELGLVRLRGHPNDELLMAAAMALHGQSGIEEDGSLMAEPLNFACGLEIDVLAGRAVLRNTPGHPRYNPQWPLTVARPRIVHFLGHHTDRVPYSTQACTLEKTVAQGWPRTASSLYAATRHTLPAHLETAFKDAFRPAFHRLFGPRRVMAGPRG